MPSDSLPQSIAQLFERRDASGLHLYDDDVVELALAHLVLGRAEIPAELGPVLARCFARANIGPGDTTDSAQTKLDAFLRAHPLPAELLQSINDLVVRAGADALSRRAGELASAIGARVESRPLAGRPRPGDGTLPGGLLGQLAVAARDGRQTRGAARGARRKK